MDDCEINELVDEQDDTQSLKVKHQRLEDLSLTLLKLITACKFKAAVKNALRIWYVR